MAEVDTETSLPNLQPEDVPVITECGPPTPPVRLPWGVCRERVDFPVGVHIKADVKPGEFVLQTLFAELTMQAEKKIEHIMTEPLERPLSKSLQRGEDAQFDQLLSSLNCVAEHCLPSLLKALFEWYNRQTHSDDSSAHDNKTKSKNKGEKDYLHERRDLAVDFIFCLVLIEVLKQLPYHPGHEDLIQQVTMQAFKHFNYKEGAHNGPNASNYNIIADLYAEVIGVLAQSRFQMVKKKLMKDLKELKARDQTPAITQTIISLLMGMKFFRVKMHPIEEFEASIGFLQECGHYFLEVKDKDIKHALAGLFVEILLPVAAVVKNEVNVPVLKNFVEMLYTATQDMSTRKKHCLALFPMVTCLLCVSQKQFFLNNWPYFLTMCLAHLRNRDPKMSRVALESLYRLLWVYMIRIKCESNTATQSRLQSIVNSLFPKGSKVIIPRDTPLNIFVKIIQFIAQERLDFAMKEIVYDLLCVGKSIKMLTPERMSVGLRSFLVITDSLQQKEGDPPMPQTMGVLPSGNTLRVKKTFLNNMLTENMAKSIGVASYYSHVRKSFDSIVRLLDSQVGKPMLLTKTENINKEPDEIIIGEKKPKMDLFRTCVAAIPRLLPDGMSSHDLVELLARLTLHMDEELKGLGFQSLQNLMMDLPSWRIEVIHGFVEFIQKEVNDTFPQLLDNSLRKLVQLLSHWKSLTQSSLAQEKQFDRFLSKTERNQHVGVLHELEGFAIVMLCNCRPITRKLAVHILKEVRNMFGIIGKKKGDEPCIIDVIDKISSDVIEGILPNLPPSERINLDKQKVDLQWLADRTSPVWVSGYHDDTKEFILSFKSFSSFDPWVASMAGFVHHPQIKNECHMAIGSAWPFVYNRLNSLLPNVDPNNTLSDNRTSSLLGSVRKKMTNERTMYLNLWHNYVVLAFSIAPTATTVHRCASPDLGSSSPESVERVEVSKPATQQVGVVAKDLSRMLVPLLRCECPDTRDIIANGIAHVNPHAFKDAMAELLPIVKEANDRKTENKTRRKKRDILRLIIARIFQMVAEKGTFSHSAAGAIDQDNHFLSPMFVDYMEGARLFLEQEGEKDYTIRMHFSGFIRQLIRNTPVEHREKLLSKEVRYNLFYLLASWSGRFGQMFGAVERRSSKEDYGTSELELSAVKAVSAILCCGPVFDASGINDDGYVYTWLDTLLATHDEKIYKLAQETIVLLLEYNSDAQSQTLLDWVIDRCYTGTHEVADGCFSALAQVFNNREYPCDHVAMLNVTLLYTGCPRTNTHEVALQLLQLLYKRFFMDDVVMTDAASAESEVMRRQALNDMLLSGPYYRPQLYLSETLARWHPELTMPIFSEVTQRFQTARPVVRQILLQYLLPWLHNLELVDLNLPPGNPLTNFLTKLQEQQQSSYMVPPLKGEGWGSTQATEMVLNNLFYITAKFGDDHCKEIEDLWASLVACWPMNLKVIMRYILIVTGMAPSTLLPYAKRVVVYLGRAKSDRLVEELMIDLQTMEPLTFSVERTQTPPFYRLTSMKKANMSASSTEQSVSLSQEGFLHTKRHSSGTEEPGLESTPRTHSTGSLKSMAAVTSTASTPSRPNLSGDEASAAVGPAPPVITAPTSDMHYEGAIMPYPLPMPAYGGFFAPLSEFLPEGTLPNPAFYRCNLAVMLMTDLVVDGIDIDWSVHLPLMLHVIFLGLDHSKMQIHEHCKKLLLNLLLVLSAHNDHFAVAKILLSNKSVNQVYALTMPANMEKHFTFIDGVCDSSIEDSPVCESVSSMASSGIDTAATTPTGALDNVCDMVDVESMNTTEEISKALIEFIATRKCRPLWSYEDITSKVHSIRSAEQVRTFLKYVLRIFKESLPLAHIEQRWAQIALQSALSCSSRHYAGRSFQVFRALLVPLTTTMLSEILSRLVETVSEQGEDMQGYVTEIMLTLESAVEVLDIDFRPMDFMKELFMSTPNLNKEPRPDMKKSATVALRQSPPHHVRSTSYSLAVFNRRSVPMAPVVEAKEIRQHRVSIDIDSRKQSTNLSRSRSAQSLKHLTDSTSHDDKLTILSQMFWLAVSLLESDFEYEFLLAVRLLEKILKHLQPDRPECREKLDKILQQINWTNFPGVQALLLKGCTSVGTVDATFNLLSKLTLNITAPVIDPSQSVGFPMNVIALLPYLVDNYEAPTKPCTDTADHISQMCNEQSKKLDNLGTVMTLYSRGTFAKDSFQWTKCVVKYLYDVYAGLSSTMVAYLVEVLEKGPSSMEAAILQILHCIVHYLDITATPVHTVNSDLLRVIAKHLEGAHWKESLKILKLAVARSSTLSMPPPSRSTFSPGGDVASLAAHTSFAEAEIFFKKELPGRTIDFNFDMTQISVIGQRNAQFESSGEGDGSEKEKSELPSERAAEESSLSTQNSAASSGSIMSGWKYPYMSQSRTRERLVNLLTCYGQRVGLPKSPSVIFSQTSEPGEPQLSVCSSSDEASLNDGIAGDRKLDDENSSEQHVFKDFDFLDNELDEVEGEGQDKFNWAMKRPSVSVDSITMTTTDRDSRSPPPNIPDDSSDDEASSVSPMDEVLQQDLAVTSTITLQNSVVIDSIRGRCGSPLSGSVHSVHSTGSDLETMDLSPSNASPSSATMVLLGLQSEEIHDVWLNHIKRLMTESSAGHAAHTYHLFSRLFHDIKRRLSSLTTEACYFLSKTESIRSIASQLSSMMDQLDLEAECPLVYVDSETLLTCKLLDKHRFNVLAMQDCYETFLMRREQALECLESIKSCIKLQSIGESEADLCGEEKRLELCRCLYKLQFQLVLLFEGYSKLITTLAAVPKPAQITDLSAEITSLKADLLGAISETETDPEGSPLNLDSSSTSPSEAINMMVEFINDKKLIRALQLVRSLRCLWPAELLHVSSDEDVEAVLILYCKHHADKRPGLLVITQSESSLSEVCSKLMDINVQLSSAISHAESTVKLNIDSHPKVPESSTL